MFMSSLHRRFLGGAVVLDCGCHCGMKRAVGPVHECLRENALAHLKGVRVTGSRPVSTTSRLPSGGLFLFGRDAPFGLLQNDLSMVDTPT
jgi:hypothetical protein